MKNKTKNILLIVLGLAVILLGARILLDDKFDNFNRYIEERENYEGGTEAYDENLKALDKWVEEYKKNNPEASDEEVSKAFNDLWKD